MGLGPSDGARCEPAGTRGSGLSSPHPGGQRGAEHPSTHPQPSSPSRTLPMVHPPHPGGERPPAASRKGTRGCTPPWLSSSWAQSSLLHAENPYPPPPPAPKALQSRGRPLTEQPNAALAPRREPLRDTAGWGGEQKGSHPFGSRRDPREAPRPRATAPTAAAFKAAQTSSTDAAKSPPSCRAIPAQLGGGGDAGWGPSVPARIPAARSPRGPVRLPLHGCVRGAGGGAAPHSLGSGREAAGGCYCSARAVTQTKGGGGGRQRGGRRQRGGHPRGFSAECSPLGWAKCKAAPPPPRPPVPHGGLGWGLRVLGVWGGGTQRR